VAATAPKRPGRHPRFGIAYSWAIVVVVATALVLAGLRWPDDLHLVAIGSVAGAAATLGWLARRRRRPGWRRWHIIGMPPMISSCTQPLDPGRWLVVATPPTGRVSRLGSR